jgi:polyisoprenoid-binding protein YceI
VVAKTGFTYILLLCVTTASDAQSRYNLTKGLISFVSNAELEVIKASSDKIAGVIDPISNQFAFTIDIVSFKGFNSGLQREHFNEKYLESERFPKARFSGKIIEEVDFSANGKHEVRAKGDLEIHGQKQTRIIKAKIVTKDGKLDIETTFTVPLEDHNITIPTIVRQKIATEVSVTFSASMTLAEIQ